MKKRKADAVETLGPCRSLATLVKGTDRSQPDYGTLGRNQEKKPGFNSPSKPNLGRVPAELGRRGRFQG
jgi:hypothetical protein